MRQQDLAGNWSDWGEYTVAIKYTGSAMRPYYGQGGDDIIYDSGDSTLAGNQIIHCDQFWIKHFANVTIPGDYIVIFAKHRILIEGDLNILRSNLAYDGNHSQQQAFTNIVTSQKEEVGVEVRRAMDVVLQVVQMVSMRFIIQLKTR